ncbi:hypothetical protein D7V97_16065 [Corallococcus sp. CA053C]|uniref:hypothetical protein n=1 Tax=Corallococcus sp. CA053C TaxID=2316732 RepID=UPI000EA077C9|nr:hypothetical protein [Corallococcus sp. CA053C]RKH09600.1 hypothetical protein D7V97_16065 [Corallococcus sp. CA053C]
MFAVIASASRSLGRVAPVCLLLVVLGACGGREYAVPALLPRAEPDAGMPRVVEVDAGPTDAGGGGVDAGPEMDAGSPDAGSPDAGLPPEPPPSVTVELAAYSEAASGPGTLWVRWSVAECAQLASARLLIDGQVVQAVAPVLAGSASLSSALLPGVGARGSGTLTLQVVCADGREATSVAVDTGDRWRADAVVALPAGRDFAGGISVEAAASGEVARVRGCALGSAGQSEVVSLRGTASGLGVVSVQAAPYYCTAAVRASAAWAWSPYLPEGGAIATNGVVVGGRPGGMASLLELPGGTGVLTSGSQLSFVGPTGAIAWATWTLGFGLSAPAVTTSAGRTVVRALVWTYASTGAAAVVQTFNADTGRIIDATPALPFPAQQLGVMLGDVAYLALEDTQGRRLVACPIVEGGTCTTAWTPPGSMRALVTVGGLLLATTAPSGGHPARTWLLRPSTGPVPLEVLATQDGFVMSHAMVQALPVGSDGALVVWGDWGAGAGGGYGTGAVTLLRTSGPGWTLEVDPSQPFAVGVDGQARVWIATNGRLLRVPR